MFLHHEVAAVVSLREDRRDERCSLQRRRAAFGVGNMGRPDRHEHTKSQFVVDFGIPQLDLFQSVLFSAKGEDPHSEST